MEGATLEGSVYGRWKRSSSSIALICALALVACGSDDPERVESVPATGFVERFAPMVHLHTREPAVPMTADEFLDHSRLGWADGKNGQVTVAIGRERVGYDAVDAPVLSPARLGDRELGIGYKRLLDKRPGCPACGTETIVAASGDIRPFQPRRTQEYLREGEGFFLDLLRQWMYGTAAVRQRDGQATVSDVPVYSEIAEEYRGKRLELRVVYWMLFGVEVTGDQTLGEREGDWERVSVLLRPTDGGERYKPVSVRYYQRDRRLDIPWNSAEVAEGGPGESWRSHPVVYLGRGDHTPYAEPVDRRRTVDLDGRPVAIREQAEACARCPVWKTWERVVNVDTEPWYSFGGAWGNLGTGSYGTGPRGPSIYVHH